jgi:hypothetical protein|tara:strand:+ start:1693 stop:1896 length:204 start_codon:yes stop_codon:yes gene_type:complete
MVIFIAKSSSDPDGQIYNYHWQFNSDKIIDSGIVIWSNALEGFYKITLTEYGGHRYGCKNQTNLSCN